MSFGGGERHSPFGGMFGKESSQSYDVYLNLTPLMDVMSNILFFLLAAFGATVLAILPTTVPTRADANSPAAVEQEEKVTLTVRADPSTLTIKADSPNIDPAKLADLSTKIGKKGDFYDLAAFNSAVKRVKERYPASKQMILVPDDSFRYEVIVRIMDAARDYVEKNAQGIVVKKIIMFDEVVLSSTPNSESK